MSLPTLERLQEEMDAARRMYHRLVLVVGPARSGKTRLLLELADSMRVPYVNVNLDLSERLLHLPARRRPLHVSRILEEVVAADPRDVVLLDNIEILFDVQLKQDPLRLLQNLSRNKTVVATWPGFLENRYVTYATPGHAEHRRSAIGSLPAIALS